MFIMMLAAAAKPPQETLLKRLLRRWRTDRKNPPEDNLGDPDLHVEMPLSAMKPGQQGHVLALRGEPETRQHLLELGFTPGTVVDFIRVAPLGDPLTVRLRGYHLSLRRREAEVLWMRRCPPETDFSPRGE